MAYPTKYSTPLTGLDFLEWYQEHKVYHPGVDFNFGYGNEDCGQEVRAAKDGFVEYVHFDVRTSKGFGKFVIIIHPDGNYTRYAHLQDIAVTQAQSVKEGEIIGHLGNTDTTYCHLHFEVFNKMCAEVQTKRSKPWRWYPSGLSKPDVQKYYLNPWKWLENKQPMETIPTWATAAVTWAKANELILNFEGNSMSDYEVSLVLMRFYQKFILNK